MTITVLITFLFIGKAMQKQITIKRLAIGLLLFGGWVQATTVYQYDAKPAALPLSLIDNLDELGLSIDIDGDIMVVGTPYEDSNATGIHTPPFTDGQNNDAENAGAAYIFERNAAGEWLLTTYLKADNTGAGDRFGSTVAVSGQTVVIGAPYEDSQQDHVGNNAAFYFPHSPANDNARSNAGAAYVFVKTGGTWQQQAFLKGNNDGNYRQYNYFGTSVAIDGERIVVGAPLATANAGAAYVFERATQTVNITLPGGGVIPFSYPAWSATAFLTATGGEALDDFGKSVAVAHRTVIVGAPGEDSNGSSPVDNSAEDSGAAYRFELLADNSWSDGAYIKAAAVDAHDYFGQAVAASVVGDKEILAIGAPYADSNGSDASDNSMQNAGAVTVLTRTTSGGSSHTARHWLTANNAESSDSFGATVALSADTLLVGAHFENSDGSHANNNLKFNAGAAYVFQLSSDVSHWAQVSYVKAPNIARDDRFARAVAIDIDGISHHRLAIGMPREDRGAITNSGGAFVYEFSGAIGTPIGSGAYQVGGAVSGTGFAGANLTLTHAGGSQRMVGVRGRFVFPTDVVSTYRVSAEGRGGQTCDVENHEGSVVGVGDIYNVWVRCQGPILSDSFEAP